MEYVVEGAWKKMDECWKSIQLHRSMYRAHFERACACLRSTRGSGPGYFVAFQTPAALRCFCAGGTVRSSQSLGSAGRQAEHRGECRAASSQTGQGKCRQRTLESAQAEYEAVDARSFVVTLQLEAAGLTRLTTEDKQRGKPAQHVDQSSALGSLLVEREDMQQAYGIKVRPNSGKSPGVLHAKTQRTSKQSSLTSRSGRSNSRTSVKSISKTSGRARSAAVQGEAAAMSSKRALLSPAGTAQAKAKVVVEAAADDVTTATRARHRGRKNGKGHKSSRNPS